MILNAYSEIGTNLRLCLRPDSIGSRKERGWNWTWEPVVSTIERLVVSLKVSKKDSQRVVLRQTTLLPAIAGLPSLLTLLFAPRAELRCNADRSRLTGALCGLGGDKDLKAYDADNDMELVFDTEITVEVILLLYLFCLVFLSCFVVFFVLMFSFKFCQLSFSLLELDLPSYSWFLLLLPFPFFI